MKNIKLFVSYSHDSPEHKEWVRRFVATLRAEGCDVVFDETHLRLGQDVVAFMDRAIGEADRVLLVCTEQYVAKANSRLGGVGFETVIASGEMVQLLDTFKFVPVVRQQTSENVRLPRYLGNRRYVDFSEHSSYDDALATLLRDLRNEAMPNTGLPLSSTVTTTTQTDRATQTFPGSVVRGTNLPPTMDDPWLTSQAHAALTGIGKTKLNGGVEFRSKLRSPIAASQLSLLDSVRSSNIRTFGWPIAVLLEARSEYRPFPTADGVTAEISISEGRGDPDLGSYDYWSARVDGAFYHYQSYFEEQRTTSAIFFNSRIVRTAESLFFLGRYYSALGLTPDSVVDVQFSHSGLANRTLGAVGGRHVFPQTSRIDSVTSMISSSVGGLASDTSVLVQKLLAPVFVLFNFTEFAPSIYDDIVTRFARGDVS